MTRATPSPALENSACWANRMNKLCSDGQKRLGSRNGSTSLGSSDRYMLQT